MVVSLVIINNNFITCLRLKNTTGLQFKYGQLYTSSEFTICMFDYTIVQKLFYILYTLCMFNLY